MAKDTSLEFSYKNILQTKKSFPPPKKISQQYASLLFKFKWPILIISFIFFLVALLKGLSLEINLNPYSQFKSHHPLNKAVSILEKNFFYSSSNELIFTTDKNMALDPAFLSKIAHWKSSLENQRAIVESESLLEILEETISQLSSPLSSRTDHLVTTKPFPFAQYSKDEIEQAFLFFNLSVPEGLNANHFISKGQDALKMSIRWNGKSSKSFFAFKEMIESSCEKFQLKCHITGKVPLFHALTPKVVETFNQSFFMAFVLIFLCFLLILKSFSFSLLAMVPNIFPLAISAGTFALLGINVDIGTVLVGSVCLGIAVDDTIHFVVNYNNFSKIFPQKKLIMENLVDSTFSSLVFTTLLIVVGLSSFALASYIPNMKFGLMSAFTLLWALMADIVILPALLFLKEKSYD